MRSRAIILALAVGVLPACHDHHSSPAATGGDLDASFGTDGAAESNPTAGGDTALRIACDGTFVYVVGYEGSGVGMTMGRIEKRSVATGALDPAFGTGGVVNSFTGNGAANDIAIDLTFMYVCGYDTNGGIGLAQWVIQKRNLSDGALVAGFGTGGVATSDVTDLPDIASALAIDGTFLYVVGYDRAGSSNSAQLRIEKRNLSDGALVAAFDGDGVVQADPTAVDDIATSVAIDAQYLYVAGYQNLGAGVLQSRLEKRNLSDGALVAAFDGDGVIVSDPVGWTLRSAHLAIDGSAIYVAGVEFAPSTGGEWRLEKRNTADGSLVPGFGTGGVLVSDPSPSIDSLSFVAVDGAVLYLAGSESTGPTDSAWRIERRLAADGSLDPAFGAGGALKMEPSPNLDPLYSLCVQPQHLFLVGTQGLGGSDTAWRVEKRFKDAP